MSEAKRIEIATENGSLYGLSWHTENSIANVVIMEGMEEYAGRYDDFAKYLNKEGFNVYAVDAYGQGENVRSDFSNRGLWPKSGFRKQVQAVDTLVNKLRISCRPTFIFSHSMGSFMCQDYIQRYTHHVSKVVLCGTGYKNPGVPFAYFLARMFIHDGSRNKPSKVLAKLMFGGMNKKINHPETKYDWLSFDKENVKKYIDDPLCGFETTKGFCYEFLKGMNRLYKKRFLSKIRKDLDVFLISGSDDPVSHYGKDTAKLEKMYKELGLESVSSKIYPNRRHEILNEANKEEVYADIVAFFKNDIEKKNIV